MRRLALSRSIAVVAIPITFVTSCASPGPFVGPPTTAMRRGCGGVGGTVRVADLLVPEKASSPPRGASPDSGDVAGGARLPAKAFAPDPSRQTGPCPVITMLPGGVVPIGPYEFAAKRLAGEGYVVILTDPRLNVVESYDLAARSAIDCMAAVACNPFSADSDLSKVGAAGHSLGSRALTKTQEIDRRVDAIVEWDNLAKSENGDDGSNNCDLVAKPIRMPRVPALGQAAGTSCIDKPSAAKATGFEHWRSAGVDTAELVFATIVHQDWASPGNDAEHDLQHWYTLAWFDRYLKNDLTATTRLTSRTPAGQQIKSVLDTHFRSALAFGDITCLDWRAGCDL